MSEQWICQTCKKPANGLPRTPTLDSKVRLGLCTNEWCPSHDRERDRRIVAFRLIDSPSASLPTDSKPPST